MYLDLRNFHLSFTTFDKLNLSKNSVEKISLLGIDFEKPEISSLPIEIMNEISFRIDQKILNISNFFCVDSIDELENFLIEKKLKEISNQEEKEEINENYKKNLSEKYVKITNSIQQIKNFVQNNKIQNSKKKQEFIHSLQSKIKSYELKIE